MRHRRVGAAKRARARPKKDDTLTLFSQRYVKKEVLGQGAFGLVYSALDQETSKTVAIKCVKNKESIEQFQAELDLLKRLHHEAIVPYLDSFVDSEGALQIVMEYAENGSLLDVIRKYGELNETVAAIYIAQVLRGLVYLHEQNVIHRDIKAANVLIHGGAAKLADFGLALDLNDYGKTLRECAGSPYWMAPEVINGEPIYHKSDIWSVGATTVELLKGHPPLYELAPVPAMFQIGGKRPMPIPHDVSDECYDFLSKCFNKNPKLRPEAADLLNHPWIKHAMQLVEPMDVFMDVESLTLRVGSSVAAASSSSSISSATVSSANQPPEEIVLALTDEKQYYIALRKTMDMLKTKQIDTQVIMNFCGLRTVIDRLENKAYVVPTLNFIQMLCSESDTIATSLIEHCIVQKLFDSGDPHSQITSLYIIMSSSVGARLFFGSGMGTTILPRLVESPLIRLFSSAFVLFLLSANLPPQLVRARFTAVVLRNIVETAFKATARYKDYMKLLNQNFQKIGSIFDGPAKRSSPILELLQTPTRVSDENQNHNSVSSSLKRSRRMSSLVDDRLMKPMLSDDLFDKASRFIDDSIAVVTKLASTSSLMQLALSTEMKPLVYILAHSSEYPVLTSTNISALINMFEIMCCDCIVRERLKPEQLVPSIVTFSYSEDRGVLSSSIRCLTRMLKDKPQLCELAADCGFGFSLSYAISKRCDVPEFISELLCHIPTVSPFAAFKMKEAGTFCLLVDLLNVREWKSKAIHAIAQWSTFDCAYVDDELCNPNTFESVSDDIAREIDYLSNSSITSTVFLDMKTIVRHCSKFAQNIMTDDFIASVVRNFTRARDAQKAALLEFFIEFALQHHDPTGLACMMLPHVGIYSESANKQLQRAVLRLRVIARC